jgi:hypothetical protein
MENIIVKTDGTKLLLTIDTTVDLGRSKSGKTNLIASSQGNVKVNVGGKDVFIGVNAYTK